MKRNKYTCTVVQCECCEKPIISPIKELPDKCPYCEEVGMYSIVYLSCEDQETFTVYIQQEG
ncbi:hypothetical protein CON36_32420 [Bacillus cereus]|uniref:Uncharacterized protein n=1 Tax=Bacillus cereus TaxID=1396 RepID=A0A9X6ST51_BACCE|nr:hypothetical protein CON36_32420 [Bacillus cereus]PGP11912.1 hypothetical protein COA01_34395 [Bacillus cereus]